MIDREESAIRRADYFQGIVGTIVELLCLYSSGLLASRSRPALEIGVLDSERYECFVHSWLGNWMEANGLVL